MRSWNLSACPYHVPAQGGGEGAAAGVVATGGGFLRAAATLRRLLQESADGQRLKEFDLESWIAGWMREELPELWVKTPAEMLRNPEGQRAVGRCSNA